MKPVRHLSCATCKTGCIEYSGEADEIHCADCAQRKAMEYYGLRGTDNPAMLPTPMFLNVMDQMGVFMGREPAVRARVITLEDPGPRPEPPPTTEWRRSPGLSIDLIMFVIVSISVGFGFLCGWIARGGA